MSSTSSINTIKVSIQVIKTTVPHQSSPASNGPFLTKFNAHGNHVWRERASSSAKYGQVKPHCKGKPVPCQCTTITWYLHGGSSGVLDAGCIQWVECHWVPKS
ncbi:hypothetical protein V8D89_015861 [Ganoderma adspersum]